MSTARGSSAAASSSGELVAAIRAASPSALTLALARSGVRPSSPDALARPTRTRPRPAVDAAYWAAQTRTSGRSLASGEGSSAPTDDAPIARRLGDEAPVVGSRR